VPCQKFGVAGLAIGDGASNEDRGKTAGNRGKRKGFVHFCCPLSSYYYLREHLHITLAATDGQLRGGSRSNCLYFSPLRLPMPDSVKSIAPPAWAVLAACVVTFASPRFRYASRMPLQ
jgi:hypothetical protein